MNMKIVFIILAIMLLCVLSAFVVILAICYALVGGIDFKKNKKDEENDK